MKKQYTMPIKSRYDDPSPDAVLHVTETDYTYWLRDMADRESMPIRPCPKALRRAADKFDAMEKRIKELEAQLAEIAECIKVVNDTYNHLSARAVIYAVKDIINREKS